MLAAGVARLGGCFDHLGSLFGHLGADLWHAAVEKSRGVGLLAGILCPPSDGVFEFIEWAGGVGHVLFDFPAGRFGATIYEYSSVILRPGTRKRAM